MGCNYWIPCSANTSNHQLMIIAATFFAVFAVSAVLAHVALVMRGKRHD